MTFRPAILGACIIVAIPACGGAGDGSSTGPSNQIITSITVNHSGDSLDVGGTLQLSAVVRDQNGNPIDGKSVTWTATDRHVVDMSATGVVTALLAGNVTVQASIGPNNGGADLRVRVPATARFALDTIGNVLNPASLGQTPNTDDGTADPSGIELPDKRIRVYFGMVNATGPGNIGSAISTDGIHFTVESGPRRPASAGASEGFASPLVYALPSGGYRVFYNGCHNTHCGLQSSTTTDGITLTADNANGLGEFTAFDQPACGGIVKLADNRYRIYCSQLVVAAGGVASPGVSAVFSATSTDLLNWMADPGVRIGQGAPTLTLDARHPTPIMNADGSISLIYYQRRSTAITPREMIANSKDGLTFDTEVDLGVAGTEPSVVQRADGSYLLYYGQQTATTGSTIGVGKLNPIVR